MSTAIKKRSFFVYVLLSIITLGIYHIYFWTKVSDDVEKLCEGDGKKTMKYVFCFLLNIITFGIFGLVWKYKLAERLRTNAARYNLNFSESGGLVLFYSIFAAPFLISNFIIAKNFNALAVAYNDYNGLVSPKKDDVFADDEEVEA